MKFDISKGQILAISSNADVYRRGEICFRENRIFNVNMTYDSTTDLNTVTAQISGEYMKYGMKVNVTGTGVVKSYVCDCNANSIWRGACKHVIALLFFISNGQYQNLESVIKNQTANKIIKAFEKQSLNEINQELTDVFGNDFGSERELRLEPEIYTEKNKSPILRLSIGDDKMYIVKSIKDLVKSIKNETIASYGKNLTVKHSLSSFDAYSRKLFAICDEQLEAAVSLQDHYFKFGGNSILERDMPISKSDLDRIFDISIGRYVVISGRTADKQKMLVTDDTPVLNFSIKTGKDGIAVSAKNVEYMGLEGAAYGYLIGYGKVFRVTEGCAKTALPFIDTFEETKNADIVFGNDSKNYFYTLILPQLKKHGLITEDLNPEEDILKPKSKLFFDCEGKRVTCRVEFVYGETGYNPIRDVSGRPENKIEEFRIIKMLEMLGFESDRVKGLYVLSKDDRIYDLYSGGLDSIRKNAEVFATDAFSGQSIIAGSKAKVGVRIAGNLLRMSVDMGDYSLADLVEAVSSYNVKKKYHRLTDGRFMNLEDEEISAAAEFISSFDVSKKDIRNDTVLLPKFRAMYLDKLISENKKINISADSEFKKLTNEFNGIENVEYEVPGELQSVLRPYQQTGFKWLKALSGYEFGGILADDMGLGKTLQVITLLLSEYGDHKLQSLVVAPTSLMYNWEHEFKKFAPIIKTVILSGTPARRQELFENTPDADVFITTYDLLKRDIEMYEKKSFRYIIADEAQYIKNPGTRNATSVKKLKSQARFALTGTPIENALSELWSIFDFILPGYLYNSSKFSRLYETPIIKDDDKERAAQLQWQISPFIMRRLKRDVLTELPDKVETTLYAEMYPEQRKIYLANLLIAKGTLDDAVESGEFMSSKLQILAQITRLRQISCHPGLYIEGYSGGSGKLDLTIETIQSAIGSGHRVLLFSQFTSMLAILRDKLSECGIDYFYLDGGTPSDKRQKMADVFNAGEKQIFLISLRAGGTGLNLTGADVVIHYDQWWNPAVMSQAADRAHRIGQDKVVQVINIVSKDSIEEKILELQSKKKDLVDSVLKEGENFISQMSIEEIRALFTAVAE